MVRAQRPGECRWEQAAPDVWRRRVSGVELNVFAVASAGGLLLVDTGSGPGQARMLLAELTAVLPEQPVCAVVNTHGHFDHCFGNEEVCRAFPGAPVYGHARLTSYLGRYWDEVCREATHYGVPAQEAAAVRPVPPDHPVSEPTALDSDRDVLFVPLEPAHTDSDLAVVVRTPDGMVVVCGDVVESAGPPQVGADACLCSWPKAVDTLLVFGGPDALYLPGHGPAVDARYVRAQRDELAACAQRQGCRNQAAGHGGRDV